MLEYNKNHFKEKHFGKRRFEVHWILQTKFKALKHVEHFNPPHTEIFKVPDFGKQIQESEFLNIKECLTNSKRILRRIKKIYLRGNSKRNCEKQSYPCNEQNCREEFQDSSEESSLGISITNQEKLKFILTPNSKNLQE